MTDTSSGASAAISELTTAIAAVRKACGDDPECKVLLSALDTAETAAKDYAEGDNDADDQPVSPKDASAKAKRMLAQGRKEAAGSEDPNK